MPSQQELLSKFRDIHNKSYSGEPKQVWNNYISNIETNDIPLLQIGDSNFTGIVNCSGWDFSRVDLVLKGDNFNNTFNFSSCGPIKSLMIKGNNTDMAKFRSEINFSGCQFLNDVEINAMYYRGSDFNFVGAKFLSSRNTLKISCSGKLLFNGITFGTEDKLNQNLELDLVDSGGQFISKFQDVKFFTEILILKSSCKEVVFDEDSVFVKESEIIFERHGSVATTICFLGHTFDDQKGITFDLIHEVKGENLSFRNCKSFKVSSTILKTKEIVECVLFGNSSSISSNLISKSIFKSKISVSDNNDYKDETTIIKNSVFKNLRLTSNSGKVISEIDGCVIQSLILGTSNIKINKSKITKSLGTENCSHLIINNSKINTFNVLPSLRHLEIKNTVITSSTFKEVRFESCAIFDQVLFKEAPRIDNIEFSSCNVDFKNVFFRKRQGNGAIGSFRALVKACKQAEYEHGVIMFHALELETYYNTHLHHVKPFSREWPEKISSNIHKKITDYGRDLMMPFRWISGLFCFGYGFNILYYINNICEQNCPNSFLLSLRNTLGPLAFALPKYYKELKVEGWLIYGVSFFQIISCSIIWFLIIFMIRRRFKI